jgi:hypothetical protein
VNIDGARFGKINGEIRRRGRSAGYGCRLLWWESQRRRDDRRYVAPAERDEQSSGREIMTPAYDGLGLQAG